MGTVVSVSGVAENSTTGNQKMSHLKSMQNGSHIVAIYALRKEQNSYSMSGTNRYVYV